MIRKTIHATLQLLLLLPLGTWAQAIPGAQPMPTLRDDFQPPRHFRVESEYEEQYDKAGSKVVSKAIFAMREYDAEGRMVRERDASGMPSAIMKSPGKTYVYDASGHVVEVKQMRSDGSVSFKETTVWDEGHRHAETKRWVAGDFLEKRTTEIYDARGLLLERTYEGPEGRDPMRSVLTYDAQHRPTGMVEIATATGDTTAIWTTTYPNDSTEVMTCLQLPYHGELVNTTIRNARGQVLSLTVDANGMPLRYTYRYDADGLLVERWFYSGFGGPSRFTYVREK